jgi:CRISPR-associated protein Csx3
MKLLLCGPPHSGKSCLREGLKQAIRRIEGAPYPYVITACPDGEGAWFFEAAQRHLESALQLKAAYKAEFTLEFATVRAQWVRNASEPLTLVDVGGKIDEKNRLIMSCATHAVILSKDMKQVSAWQEFCFELNLRIVAVIYSDYHGIADQLQTEVPILQGSIHYLERGQDVSSRPMVQKLAQLLVHLSSG